MKITMRPFIAKFLFWEEVKDQTLIIENDYNPKNLGFIACNEQIYNCMQLMKSEAHSELTYLLCEHGFCLPEVYGLPIKPDPNEMDVFITKYAVSDVKTHYPVGYIICTWTCDSAEDTLKFYPLARKYISMLYGRENGIPADYRVYDENKNLLFESNFKFNPMIVMFSPDPLNAFASLLRMEVNESLKVSNFLGIEDKFRLDMDDDSFEFVTLEGDKLKVKCKQWLAAKDWMNGRL